MTCPPKTGLGLMLAGIPHIGQRVSKGPEILDDGDGGGIHERRQLSHCWQQAQLGQLGAREIRGGEELG